MKSVVMINVDPEALDRLTKEEWLAFDQAHRDVQTETRGSAELIYAQQLADPVHATIVHAILAPWRTTRSWRAGSASWSRTRTA